MALVDLVMPKMGESIMEATILKWHKKPGEPVKRDETLLEIATDKVDSEVPSTAEGILEETLFNENDVVPVGAVIARIRSGADAANTTSAPVNSPSAAIAENRPQAATAAATTVHQTVSTQYRPASNGSGNRFYSPLVLNIAANEGVSMSELEKIPGSGNEGRVTKKDILQYVESKRSGKSTGSTINIPARQESVPSTSVSAPDSSQLQTIYSGNVEIVEMDRMRKLIAKHMVDSKHTSPHVTSFA